jgi:hypothetical protein
MRYDTCMKNELTHQETIARGMQQHKRDQDSMEALKLLSAICMTFTLGGVVVGGLLGWLVAIPSAYFSVMCFVEYFRVYNK